MFFLPLKACESMARGGLTLRRWIQFDLDCKIYNWFTEGFDTADLKDAKALLDELSA
jgi:hypothetical protein